MCAPVCVHKRCKKNKRDHQRIHDIMIYIYIHMCVHAWLIHILT